MEADRLPALRQRRPFAADQADSPADRQLQRPPHPVNKTPAALKRIHSTDCYAFATLHG